MTKASIEGYIEAVRDRYRRADKKEKGRILDEAVQGTGYHRKALTRHLGRKGQPAPGRRRGRPRLYGPEAAEALRFLWEATDRLCSRRLHPFLPELVRVLRWQGERHLGVEVETLVLRMSPSTIDPFRERGGRRSFSTTKPESLLKGAIPVHTLRCAQDRLWRPTAGRVPRASVSTP